MHIVLLCATRRGRLFLEKLAQIAPDHKLTVFSFHEEPHEPPFFEDIRATAEQHGAQFYETRQVGAERWQEFWQNTPVDLMLAVSWRYLVPARVYQHVRMGTFVFHDSLLPTYRGFAPTVWALINGEDHTGVTLFEIAEDVDSGPIIDQERVPLAPNETIAEALEAVTQTYLTLLERNLQALLAGTASRRLQDERLATYTCKRTPADNIIDWTAPTQRIYNLIRAVTHPYPGAYTTLEGQKLLIWAANPLWRDRHYVGRLPGRVVEIRSDGGVVVLTGDGELLITTVQLENSDAPTDAARVLNKISYTLGS